MEGKKYCKMKYECMSRCMRHEKLAICMSMTTYGRMWCIMQGGMRMQKKSYEFENYIRGILNV